MLIRLSLPQTRGAIRLPGLAHVVTITRDSQGVPTIRAADALDAWRALGYVEAQDRFFQMDLLRRAGSGRLSALLGKSALKIDERRRLFFPDSLARQAFLEASASVKARLEAYALGVNEGLQHLSVRPWQYLLLDERPRSWQPQDAYLIDLEMGYVLEDPFNRRARSLAVLHQLYQKSVVAFLMSPDTRWASPSKGKPPSLPPLPATQNLGFSATPPRVIARAGFRATKALFPGSNSFAVASNLTKSNVPLLANDMHLQLRVPPTWYRAKLIYPDPSNPKKDVTLTGIFLPGVPMLVAGSNGHIAWGMTDSYGDWADLIRLSPHAEKDEQYATGNGTEPLTVKTVRIKIRDGKPVSEKVYQTKWGPVVGKAANGDFLVSHWVLAQPGGMNLELGRLADAKTVKQALDIAQQAGIPPENFTVIGHEKHHIGWTIAGRIPSRKGGCDYAVPETWAGGKCGWQGWVSPDNYPRIVNPPSGILVTANNDVDRAADGDIVGNGGFSDGIRAFQITADLKRLQAGTITTSDLLKIQLDDKALFLQPWKNLLLNVLRPAAVQYHPKRKAFLHYIATWGDAASVNSVGYRLVKAFRQGVIRAVFAPLFARARRLYPQFQLPFRSQIEGPLWRLVRRRPANWLNPRYATWNALFMNVIDGIIHRLWKPASGLKWATWGNRNKVAIDEPLAKFLPWGSSWLDMPVRSLPGDVDMPRVQAPHFGASMRMVVSPKANSQSLFELPGGESGHPLSPYYKDEFAAWAEGRATPFNPGKARVTLRLLPWKSTGDGDSASPGG